MKLDHENGAATERISARQLPSFEVEVEPKDESEARKVLAGKASYANSAIPADLIASHVRRVYGGAPWSVQRAAVEAIQIRRTFARHGQLAIRTGPKRQRILGQYRIGSPTKGTRTYAVSLTSIDPIAASCECIDFLKNGLGVCKHILTALEGAIGDRKAFDDVARRAAAEKESQRPCVLGWQAVRSLEGRADRLERLEFARDLATKGPGAKGTLAAHLRADKSGVAVDPRFLADPVRRRDFVAAARAVVATLDENAVEPAARAVLELEASRWIAAESDKAIKKEIAEHIRSLDLELFPYQVEGVRRFLERGRLLLADDMGLGKTAQAIAAAHILFHSGRATRGIIFAPAALKGQWQREWTRFSDAPITIVDGSPEQRRAAYKKHHRGFLIVNYELLLRDLDAIRAVDADIVVLDEAQRIKNWTTRTAKSVKSLEPRYRLILTGTPMENRFEELASLLEWLGDDALEPVWRLHPLHRSTPGVVTGLDTLRERLAESTLRRSRAEVLTQLPPRRDTMLSIRLTPEQAEAHEALSLPIAQLAARAARRPLMQAEFLKLMQLLTQQRMIADGMALYDFTEVFPDLVASRRNPEALLAETHSPKLEEFRELVANLVVQQGRKLVVFSQWVRMIKLAAFAIDDVLERAGKSAVFFTGEQSPKAREAGIVAFHDDPKVAIFFATDAGGVGLNLQRAADVCVNLDMPWNPAVLEQRIGRVYRLGQKKPIDVFHLVTELSIEERISRLVGEKKAMFDGLFEGTSDEVRFDDSGGFAARLKALIQPTDDSELSAARRQSVDLDDDQDMDEVDDKTVEAAVEPTVEAAVESAPPPIAALENIRVNRTADGSVTFTAPPAAAALLSQAFRIMADLMAATAAK